ncbi:MAG: hypothetical protein ABL874_01475, partial [Sphingopyxis sp.]
MTDFSSLSRHIVATASVLAIAAMPTTPARAGEPVTLSYYLPRTSFVATVQHRLMACPVSGGHAEVATLWTLRAATRPDYAQHVRLDASSGFLVRRSVEMTFAANGTLTAINAESEGQGPEVVSSVLGLAGTILPMLGGVPRGPLANTVLAQSEQGVWRGGHSSAPPSPCTDRARALLDELENVRGTIALLQDAVASEDFTPIQARALNQLIAREDNLVNRLTITVGQHRFAPGESEQSGNAHIARLAPVVYARWFNNPEAESSHIFGNAYGYRVAWVVNAADYNALR